MILAKLKSGPDTTTTPHSPNLSFILRVDTVDIRIGQSGSGKTHTIFGAEGKLGIAPRMAERLFSSMEAASEAGWIYTLTASFLEICDDEIRDLLGDGNTRRKLQITDKEVNVLNLTKQVVTNAPMLNELMMIAQKKRKTSSTAANNRSSRSHSVTQLQIVGKHSTRPEFVSGKIDLVDLAGSESAKNSQDLSETGGINASLFQLQSVLSALAKKSLHVPFRNSTLTSLLKSSLEGSSKILMICNISPLQENYAESFKSLDFAKKVKQVKKAAATANRQFSTK